MIEALGPRVNGDAALVRRGRYLTTTFLLEVGSTAWLIASYAVSYTQNYTAWSAVNLAHAVSHHAQQRAFGACPDGDVAGAAALAGGRTIEQKDIDDLTRAGQGVTAPDVTAVYAALNAASQMHLRAFGR